VKIRTPTWLPWALLAAAFVAIALLSRDSDPPSVPETVVRQVVPEEYQAILRTALIDNHGLRARLAGITEIEPDTVFMTDTLVAPPDTVIRTVTIRDGVIRWAPLFRADSLYVPEVRVASFGDCDDGLEIRGGRVICDPAVLGHLSLVAQLGATRDWLDPLVVPMARAGLHWTPSYRSPWGVYVVAGTDGAHAWVSRRWELF